MEWKDEEVKNSTPFKPKQSKKQEYPKEQTKKFANKEELEADRIQSEEDERNG